MKITGAILLLNLSVWLSSCNTRSTGPQSIVSSADSTKNFIDSTSNNSSATEFADISRIDSAFTSNSISDTSQLMMVTGTSAISLWPDEEHLEKEKQVDSDGFYSMADDYSFYTAIASDTLAQHQITQLSYQHEKRYVVFKSKGGVVCVFDGNKMPDSWGTLLFNGNDTPVLWNGTNIAPAIKLIFKK